MKKTAETMQEMVHLWVDTMQAMARNPLEAMGKAWSAETYSRWYDLHSRMTSEILEGILRTPGFAAQSWEMVKGTSPFRKFSREMMETAMKTMELPTGKDINELHERLDSLEDRIESMEKEFKAGKATAKKPAAKKSAAKK
ncbi:MAG: hypothetical protein RDV48_01255 [Candidatus Eremiobacteraeota bacterium]|nr:hypothetical protein [Candidatus Eremiobacteraeota bacterium]